MMQVANRMRTLRLINKINRHELYCERIGVEDVSQYRGKQITKKECDENINKEKEVLSMTLKGL